MGTKLAFTKEGKTAVDKARADHAAMFEGLEPGSDPYNDALMRWAKTYPREVEPYQHAIGTEEKSFPLEYLNHWEAIEYFSRDLVGEPIQDVLEKWTEANPTKGGGEKKKSGFGGKDVPHGPRD